MEGGTLDFVAGVPPSSEERIRLVQKVRRAINERRCLRCGLFGYAHLVIVRKRDGRVMIWSITRDHQFDAGERRLGERRKP